MSLTQLDDRINSYKKMIIPLIITFGAIITATVAWIQWSEQKQKAKENKTLNEENSNLLNRIANLASNSNVQLSKSNKQLTDLSGKLMMANDQIRRLQNETINNITGGDNKPIITINIAEDIENQKYQDVTFWVNNKGKYPIKNIELTINDHYANVTKVNWQKRDKTNIESNVESVNPENKDYSDVFVSKGDLPKGSMKTLYSTKFISDLKYVSYFFKIQWQNGIYNGKIAFERLEGKRDYKAYVIGAWDNDSDLKDVIIYSPTKYNNTPHN